MAPVRTTPRAGTTLAKGVAGKSDSPSRLIDARFNELADGRGKTLAHVRALIRQAVPEVVEEWKWRAPRWILLAEVTVRMRHLCTADRSPATVEVEAGGDNRHATSA